MTIIAEVGVGVDVSKTRLDVFIYPKGISFSVPNTKPGIKKLIKKLEQYDFVHVGCEATGGYEAKLVEMVSRRANTHVSKINPRCISGFKKCISVEAKTDLIDAAAIAQFIMLERKQTFVTNAPTSELQKLALQREHFKRMLAGTRTYVQAPLVEENPKYAAEIIEAIAKVVEKLTAKIDEIIAKDPEMLKLVELIKSIPGCGDETAKAFLVHVPEAGNIENKQLCSLLGLAPFARESGSWNGKRYIRFGRPAPRRILYMAALSASRCNQILKRFYDGLVARGKSKKLALIAVARRLACMINAILRDQNPWRDQ